MRSITETTIHLKWILHPISIGDKIPKGYIPQIAWHILEEQAAKERPFLERSLGAACSSQPEGVPNRMGEKVNPEKEGMPEEPKASLPGGRVR